MRHATVAVVLLGLLLAGCTDAGGDDGPAVGVAAGPDASPDQGTVEGVVVDGVYRPVQNATVATDGDAAPTRTDADGVFRLLLPPGNHTLVVGAEGYLTEAGVVQVHAGSRIEWGVTLQRAPPPPRVEVQSFAGFIQCDVIVQPTHSHGNGHTHNNQRCDEAMDARQHVWDIPLRPGVDGLVLELAWEPNQDLARYLYVRVEAEDGTLVADTEMDSPLRLQVAQAQLHEHVPDGGMLRMVALVGTGEDAGGANDLGVAVQFQQEFEAFASAFYGQPSAPDYSLLR